MCFVLLPCKTAEGPLWRCPLRALQTKSSDGWERQAWTFKDQILRVPASVVLFSSNLLIHTD